MVEIIADRWHGRTAAELANEWDAAEVHLFAQVGSTNDVAKRLGAGGAAAGTVVIAEYQTAARGRVGRAWATPAGQGVGISIVLRPASGADLAALPLVIGATLADALDPFLPPYRAGVKWPNDVLVDGRKLAGILCEAVWEGGTPGTVVAGIGINLLQQEHDFPRDLRDSATSLRIVQGTEPDVARVVGACVKTILHRLVQSVELTDAEHDALLGRDTLRGKEVRITEPESGSLRAAGTALGITRDGSLAVRDTAGVVRTVRSGTVSRAVSGISA